MHHLQTAYRIEMNFKSIFRAFISHLFVAFCSALLFSSFATGQSSDPSQLFSAAGKGDAIKISQVVAAGVNVNAADSDGWTALMVAASAGKLPAAQALVKAGANVNATTGKGETPLMAAALSGNAAIVKLLLSEGANKAATSAQGLTAVDVAIRAKHPDLVKLLQPAQGAKAVAAPLAAANPKKVEAKVDAAASAFQAGRYAEAAGLFREVVTLDPRHALAWHFLGQSLEQTGDLIGARKAYGLSLATQSQGQVADRTRQMLAKLPLPDPARIALPSGLTLLDWMNTASRRLPAESDAVLAEASAYIDQFGPFPQLSQLQDQILKDEFAALKVDSADAARASLPQIERLKKMAPGNERLILLEATGLHMTGNFTGAQKAYGIWLGSVPTGHPRRLIVATNIQKAQRGEEPLKPKTRPQLPFQLSEEVWKALEESEAYAFAPEVKSVNIDYTQTDSFRGGGVNFDNNYTNSKRIRSLGSGVAATENSSIDEEHRNYPVSRYSSYSAAGMIFLGGVYSTGVTKLIRINHLSGSLFPLRIGARMSYESATRSGNDGSEHKYRVDCKIASQEAAATLNPKLTGNAYLCECSISSDSAAPAASTTYIFDDLGLTASDLGVIDIAKSGFVIPTPGYSFSFKVTDSTVTRTYPTYDIRF
ncbi:MAG: ankyrin repeat domain-containing protein [Azonexus sp.]